MKAGGAFYICSLSQFLLYFLYFLLLKLFSYLENVVVDHQF